MSETADTFFFELENSYIDRCKDTTLSCKAWKNVLKQFPADTPERYDIRPSFHLAEQSGDMGAALIWIVQAALTRPLIEAFSDAEQNNSTLESLKKITQNDIGALAISESRDQPLTVKETDTTMILNGEKKYITGGSFSDFILLAGRYRKEEKLSCMFLVPVTDIPEHAFEELDLGCFYTSSHARLTLENYHPPLNTLLSISPSKMRKLLLIWGIIERSMILESIAGLALYLAGQVREYTGETILEAAPVEAGLEQLGREINQQIKSAREDDFVQPLNPMPEDFMALLQRLEQFYKAEKNQLQDEMSYRFRDLIYFAKRFASINIS